MVDVLINVVFVQIVVVVFIVDVANDVILFVVVNTSLAAPGALAHLLQRGTVCNACNAAPPAPPPAKSKMDASGPQNGRRGLERCLPPGLGAF